MVIDLRKAPQDLGTLAERLRSQICIVGGGLAGLELAERLALQGNVRVTLLEAGDQALPLRPETDPFRADFSGSPHRGTAQHRVRALGGTSLTWGGQLLPLPVANNWPLASVSTVHSAEDRLSEAEVFFGRHHVSPPALLQAFPELTPRLSSFLPFGQRSSLTRLRRHLRSSRFLTVVTHATVTALVRGSEDRVKQVRVKFGDGRDLLLEAEQFVLAAGTVETCRLLLASGFQEKLEAIGRGFHDHLTLPAAELTGPARASVLAQLRPWVFFDHKSFSNHKILGDHNCRRILYSLKLEAGPHLWGADLLPAMAHVTIQEPENSGIAQLRSALKLRQSGNLLAAVPTILRSLPRALLQGARLLWSARARHRRYVSPRAKVSLQLNLAQEVADTNSISLGREFDRFGMPLARVHWEVSRRELIDLRRFAGYLRKGLTAAGIAEGVLWEPELFADAPGSGDSSADTSSAGNPSADTSSAGNPSADTSSAGNPSAGDSSTDDPSTDDSSADARLRARLDDARHAMGGARMGTDPLTSVVDPELRVHGFRNLSVASAAVFPDGSPQLPTLTLLRLCRGLATRLQKDLACGR